MASWSTFLCQVSVSTPCGQNRLTQPCLGSSLKQDLHAGFPNSKGEWGQDTLVAWISYLVGFFGERVKGRLDSLKDREVGSALGARRLKEKPIGWAQQLTTVISSTWETDAGELCV